MRAGEKPDTVRTEGSLIKYGKGAESATVRTRGEPDTVRTGG